MKLRTLQQGVQQQALTQALRQSLHILQMPLLDLQEILSQELESNPVLEELVTSLESLIQGSSGRSEMTQAADPSPGQEEEEEDFLSSIPQPPPSLTQFLLQQFNTRLLNSEEKTAGEAIIGNLDKAGYLLESIEEIAASLKLPAETVEKTLRMVQQCEPVGIGGRSLQECLLIQLRAQGLEKSLAGRLVSEGVLDAVANPQQHERLAHRFKTTPQEIAEAAQKIRSLSPRPGERISSFQELPAIVPDIIITKDREGEFHITLRESELPSLRISPYYKKMLTDPAVGEEARSFVRERILSASVLLRGVQQRHQTMRNLAEALIRLQPAFLEKGNAALCPMTHKDVAVIIKRHPSTVARAVSRKYLECPAGTFLLANLFSSSLKTVEGNAVSAETAKAHLQSLVEKEDPQNPLSDEALMDRARTEGILLARRTVAKYRQQLEIPPAHQRRRRLA